MGWKIAIWTILLACGPISEFTEGYSVSDIAEHYHKGLQTVLGVIEHLFRKISPMTKNLLTPNSREFYQRGIESILSVIEKLFGGISPIPIPVTRESNDKEYDFIIVGSGSAGSVLANRLTEIGSWKVLLLEAGKPENSLAQYPALAPILQFTDYNWGYTMEPQDNFCLAMKNQRCLWPRGKALGGSTVINYMGYTRGNPQDYNLWAASGNPGWSYEDVLPYFLKSEDSRLRNSNQVYHNTGGYQSVEDAATSELGYAFVHAGQELGYTYTDPNSPEQIGFSKLPATLRVGRRHSTANAFLKPILHRENLHILTGAKVTKIVIDPSTNTAEGVIYNKNDKKMFARATKEVIVSAGVLSSPQLLMLSGVGPRVHLEEHGIETLSDLPVGETLYDHIAFYGLVLNTNLNMSFVTDLFDSVQLTRWYTTGEGPLSSIAGSEALAFINTKITNQADDYPDLEIVLNTGAMPADYGVINRKVLGMSDDFYQRMYSDMEGIPSFTMMPVLLHPKSKGHMKLRSADPYDYPLLYGNYLTDFENVDARTLIAGIRFIIQISESEAFKKYGVRLNTKPFVGCEYLPFNSDEYWYCALQLMTSTLHHQISTCKMGPVDDPTAVVNHELKVYGIEKLRVVDASIVPVPLSAHMNAPTIMVGEMASDLIKRDWGVL